MEDLIDQKNVTRLHQIWSYCEISGDIGVRIREEEGDTTPVCFRRDFQRGNQVSTSGLVRAPNLFVLPVYNATCVKWTV